MSQCLLQVGVHLHIPELRDDEIQVGDCLRLLLRVALQKQFYKLGMLMDIQYLEVESSSSASDRHQNEPNP